MVVLLLVDDVYHNCQIKGLNNMCFYGDYPIFGDARTHRLVAILSINMITIVSVGGWLLPKSSVTWILQPSTLAQADRVFVSLIEQGVDSELTQQHKGCVERCCGIISVSARFDSERIVAS